MTTVLTQMELSSSIGSSRDVYHPGKARGTVYIYIRAACPTHRDMI